ncbi:helix-turn-helix domain-containing protein [Streptococcus caviae]|uniref:helix-turn-helix domain-containing protein n=1 Tax=Streptococcus sp. 'caviae' TaxID=1915004 RepID=UPI00094B944D|nr:S24 family peptidase [Streptococcus sp. 'caviae']OLN84578.1 XRE family transcriptional regulator [Streptococcus sp. 'caviae']
MENKERMKIIANNITYFRKQKGITQKELAKKIGIQPSTLSDYINLRSAPSFGIIQKLADYFEINKSDIDTTFKEKDDAVSSTKSEIQQIYDQLYEPRQIKVIDFAQDQLDEQTGKSIDVTEKRTMYKVRKRIRLPAPGKVSAGSGYWQEDDYDTMVDFYADEIPNSSDYDTIAIVVGHSMEPKIKNGDFLFIKLTNQVDLNKIGIFKVNGENYVKKLRSNYLESLNKEYNDIQLSANDDIRTIGEVVDIYREN